MNEASAFAVKIIQFPIWRVIENGGMSGNQLLVALEIAGVDVGFSLKNAITSEEFKHSPKKGLSNLTRCAIRDLGFSKEPKIKQIWERIKEVGKLCPHDLGVNLRLNLPHQPNKDGFLVAMETLPMSFDNRGIFYICRTNDMRGRKKLHLEICAIGEDAPCSLRTEIVFIPK